MFFRKSVGLEAPRGSPNPFGVTKPTLFPRLLYFSRSAYSGEVRDVPSSEWKLPSGTSFLLSSAGQLHCTLHTEPQLPYCGRTAHTRSPALPVSAPIPRWEMRDFGTVRCRARPDPAAGTLYPPIPSSLVSIETAQ